MRVKKIIPIFCAVLSFHMIANCQKTQVTQKPNVLLICVDDLRPELKSFGADYISSPNIDHLAAEGIKFQKHFANAPSCGPSRYTLLTGQYGTAGNNALFLRANKIKDAQKK